MKRIIKTTVSVVLAATLMLQGFTALAAGNTEKTDSIANEDVVEQSTPSEAEYVAEETTKLLTKSVMMLGSTNDAGSEKEVESENKEEDNRVAITQEQYDKLVAAVETNNTTKVQAAVKEVCQAISNGRALGDVYGEIFGAKNNSKANAANCLRTNGVASYFYVPGEEEDECEHEWIDATCSEPKTCALCGATEGKPLGHDWVDATCTEGGHCSRCGLRDTTGTTYPLPLGHDYDENFNCTRCGYHHEHTMTDWAFDPDNPEKHFRECGDMCSIDENGHNLIREEANHNFEYDEASKKFICKDCGCEKPHEHEFSDWEVWNKDGCNPKHRRKCPICQLEEYSAHNYVGGKCVDCGYEIDIYKRYKKYTELYKKNKKNVNTFYAAEIRNYGFASIDEYLNYIKCLEEGVEAPEVHPFVEKTLITYDAIVTGTIKIFGTEEVKAK